MKTEITMEQILDTGLLDGIVGPRRETPDNTVKQHALANLVRATLCEYCQAHCSKINPETGEAYVEPLSKGRECGVGV